MSNNTLALQESVSGTPNTFFDGAQSINGTNKPKNWNKRLAETLALVENHAQDGVMKWQRNLSEAMSTGDFPALFSAILDREMLARYKSLGPVWRNILKPSRLKNFNTVDRYIQGTGAQSLQLVREGGEYLRRDIDAGLVQYKPFKYGATTSFTFEGILNDDLDFFSDTSQDFAESAMNTENRLATSLFMGAGGPNGAFFNDSESGQKGISTLAFTRLNLETAIQEMMGSTDGFLSSAGEPILNTPQTLMVPPALQLQAEEVLSPAAMIIGATGALTTSQNIIAERGLTLIVNPWLPIINTTSGNTSWYLFSGTVKPGEMGRIVGHENPEIFIKSSNAMSIGGGDSGPLVGSFENDEVTYKVRYIQGETTLDPRGGWASAGTA